MKLLKESRSSRYVNPFYNAAGDQAGWKSSNGNNVKYWRLSDSAKLKAYAHAGISPENANQLKISTQIDEKQRLDPKCWKGYKKSGTKLKGSTRVNNCVKIGEGWEHEITKLLKILESK